MFQNIFRGAAKQDWNISAKHFLLRTNNKKYCKTTIKAQYFHIFSESAHFSFNSQWKQINCKNDNKINTISEPFPNALAYIYQHTPVVKHALAAFHQITLHNFIIILLVVVNFLFYGGLVLIYLLFLLYTDIDIGFKLLFLLYTDIDIG